MIAYMKQYPNGGFCWPGHSSSGVNPIVSSLIPSCVDTSQVVQKTKDKQQIESGRKKQTKTDLELQMQEVNLAHLSIPDVFVFMAIARTLQKSYTATKNADSSGHRPNFPTFFFGVSLTTELLLCSRLTTLGSHPQQTNSLYPSLLVSQVFASTALCAVFVPK